MMFDATEYLPLRCNKSKRSARMKRGTRLIAFSTPINLKKAEIYFEEIKREKNVKRYPGRLASEDPYP